MTGTFSGCQNCFPPKDEVLVNGIFFFLLFYYCIHPSGEGESLREMHFWEGLRVKVEE
jgi:hypothetical protein